jgi:hypothetical protein
MLPRFLSELVCFALSSIITTHNRLSQHSTAQPDSTAQNSMAATHEMLRPFAQCRLPLNNVWGHHHNMPAYISDVHVKASADLT